MFPLLSILLVGCLTQLVSAGVVRSHLMLRDDTSVKARATCQTPPAISEGTLNLTLPDPDPSVNASLQYLPTGNVSVYIVQNSSTLQNIADDDSNSGTATHRRSLFKRTSSWFKRASAGGASAGGHDEDDGAGAGGGGSGGSYTGSSGRPSTEGSESSGSGLSRPSTSESDESAAKPPTPPDAVHPATGFLPKVSLTDQRELPVQLSKVSVVLSGGSRVYYNDQPASNLRDSNATYDSPSSYYSEYGFTNYNSITYWFDYQYQGFYHWFYPAYMNMPYDTANPGIGGTSGTLNGSSSIDSTSGFEDPFYVNISSSQGVVTYSNNGSLYLVNGTDQSNQSLVNWTGDHLLETELIAAFFNSSAAANSSVNWASVWSQIQSCQPWGAAVTAILNVPSNLVGLDVTLNRLKTIFLTSPYIPSEWDRSPAVYEALYSYMTIILPNYMATAQAIDTLFGQISGTPNKTNNVFAQWAYDIFYNATYTLATHANMTASMTY